MLPETGDIGEIARLIQLAVAPVFLLSGIGAFLAVMTNRLSRVIDRARILESKIVDAAATDQGRLHFELQRLEMRARLIGRAITLCTVTALLVCTVIAIL